MKQTVTKRPTTCCNSAYKLCFVQFVYMHVTLCKIHSSVQRFTSFMCFTHRHIFFITVLLHNSVHTVHLTPLETRRAKTPAFSRVSSRIGHSSACHRYQRAAPPPFSFFLSCVIQIEPVSPFSLLTTQPCSFM